MLLNEGKRFRLLSWLARRLGFDLSEVTPDELAPRCWYIKRELARDGFFISKSSSRMYMAHIIGPFTWREANDIMHEYNGIKIREYDPYIAPPKEDNTSQKIINALLGQKKGSA